MTTLPYNSGYANTLVSLGLTKQAARIPGGVGSSFVRWLRSLVPTKKGLIEGAIGQPRRFYQEIRSGKAFAPGSLMRESWATPGWLDKLLWYGIPAMELYGIASDPPGTNKAERIGGALGGALLGMTAFKPLGMVGSMVLDPVGRAIGSGVVKGTKKILPQKEPLPQQLVSAPNPYGYPYYNPPGYPYNNVTSNPYLSSDLPHYDYYGNTR